MHHQEIDAFPFTGIICPKIVSRFYQLILAKNITSNKQEKEKRWSLNMAEKAKAQGGKECRRIHCYSVAIIVILFDSASTVLKAFRRGSLFLLGVEWKLQSR